MGGRRQRQRTRHARKLDRERVRQRRASESGRARTRVCRRKGVKVRVRENAQENSVCEDYRTMHSVHSMHRSLMTPCDEAHV